MTKRKRRKFVKVGGRRIEVIPKERAEEATYAICAPADWPARFDDDEFGTCIACGKSIRFRPHCPRKPSKLCVPCAYDLVVNRQ
jgi:hypothetical protein